MKYVSNDGNVFNTESECLRYEKILNQKYEEEMVRRKQLELDRKNRLEVINKKYKELQQLVYDFGKDYGTERELYFMPFCELATMLCDTY